jgi:hypothetical protein
MRHSITVISATIMVVLFLSFAGFPSVSQAHALQSSSGETGPAPDQLKLPPPPVALEQGNSSGPGPAGIWPPPFVSAYMTSSYFPVVALQAHFTFGGTNPSVIQSDNHLYIGIYSTVFSATISGQDYGYEALVVLTNTGYMYLGAQVYQVCEGNAGCGTPSEKVIFRTTSSPSMGVNDQIMLLMFFSGPTVYWYYQINSNLAYQYASFNPPSDSQLQFEVGTYVAWNGVTAKYFQLGLESDYNIGHSGWYATISQGQYEYNGYWCGIPQAKAAQGTDSFMDYWWKWGGSDYTGVDAFYQHNVGFPFNYIEYYWSGSTTLGDGTLLWG